MAHSDHSLIHLPCSFSLSDTHTDLFCGYERASCEQTRWTYRKINSSLEEKPLCHSLLTEFITPPFKWHEANCRAGVSMGTSATFCKIGLEARNYLKMKSTAKQLNKHHGQGSADEN